MKHFASPKFWRCYRTLPLVVRELADKNFDLLKDNPYHPSLHFKKIGAFRSVRVGTAYRALAIEDSEDLIWFWIGNHSEYDKIVS